MCSSALPLSPFSARGRKRSVLLCGIIMVQSWGIVKHWRKEERENTGVGGKTRAAPCTLTGKWVYNYIVDRKRILICDQKNTVPQGEHISDYAKVMGSGCLLESSTWVAWGVGVGVPEGLMPAWATYVWRLHFKITKRCALGGSSAACWMISDKPFKLSKAVSIICNIKTTMK